MTDSKSNDNQEKKFTAHHAKLIIILVIALLLVIFAIQNAQEVTISLWFWVFRASMALALMICLVSGFLLSFIYFIPLLRKKDQLLREKEKTIARLKSTGQPKQPEPKRSYGFRSENDDI